MIIEDDIAQMKLIAFFQLKQCPPVLSVKIHLLDHWPFRLCLHALIRDHRRACP